MAIQYGALVVDGLEAKAQTLSLSGQTTGLTNALGFMGIQETLVHALDRVGAAGWALNTAYPDNTNQTYVLLFSRQQ